MNTIKTVVVKVGTSSITYPNGNLNFSQIDALTRVLSDIKNSGLNVVLVTSGAIGVGVSKLSIKQRPEQLKYKQACAAVGQCELMHTYDKFFLDYGQKIAQILLTRSDIDNDSRRDNLVNTFSALFEYGCIPVINENDSISTDEIEFGDNDSLSAIVACACNADLLFILSDIDGFFTSDPRTDANARLIPVITQLSRDVVENAGGAGSARGTGGMLTKVHAAQIAANQNIKTIILNGSRPQLILNALKGESVGTLFDLKEDAPIDPA